KSPQPDEKVQALRWLGNAYRLQGDWKAADQYLTQSRDELKKMPQPSAWRPGTLKDWARLPLREAESFREKNPHDPAVVRRLEEARQRAEEIQDANPSAAAYVRGQVLELLPEPALQEALAAYDSVPVGKFEDFEAMVQVLLARLNLLLQPGW